MPASPPGLVETYVHVGFARSAQFATYADRQQPVQSSGAATQVHSSQRVVVGERMASRQAQLASSVTVWIVDGVGCCAPPAASTLTARPVTPLMASRKNSLRSPPPGTRLSGIAR